MVILPTLRQGLFAQLPPRCLLGDVLGERGRSACVLVVRRQPPCLWRGMWPNDIANRAAGLQRRYRPVKDVADKAGEVWITAEKRLGHEPEDAAKGNGRLRSKNSVPEGHRVATNTRRDGVDKKRSTLFGKERELLRYLVAEFLPRFG